MRGCRQSTMRWNSLASISLNGAVASCRLPPPHHTVQVHFHDRTDTPGAYCVRQVCFAQLVSYIIPYLNSLWIHDPAVQNKHPFPFALLHFFVHVDHRPLCTILPSPSPNLNPSFYIFSTSFILPSCLPLPAAFLLLPEFIGERRAVYRGLRGRWWLGCVSGCSES